MATLSIQNITESGINATYSAAAELGDTFANSGKQFVHVKNDSMANITVSCDADVSSVTVPAYGELSKANISVAIPAGEDRFIGPFPVAAFGRTPVLEYTAHADLSLAVMEV